MYDITQRLTFSACRSANFSAVFWLDSRESLRFSAVVCATRTVLPFSATIFNMNFVGLRPIAEKTRVNGNENKKMMNNEVIINENEHKE